MAARPPSTWRVSAHFSFWAGSRFYDCSISKHHPPSRRNKTFGRRAPSSRSIFCRAAGRPGSRRASRRSTSIRGVKKDRTAAREPASSRLCARNPCGVGPYSVCSPSNILRADAALVGLALNLTGSGFEWHENVISGPGFSVGIYNGCSSFHNISLAALCWISWTKLHRPTFIRSDFKFGAVGARDDRAANAARLYAISLGRESFDYWHDRAGAHIFAVTALFVIAAICAWGASN